jgi:hypothetical protein
MLFRWGFGVATLFLCTTFAIAAEEPVFSGPQVGEAFPPLPVKLVLGDQDGKEADLVKNAGSKPLVVIFFHARTRPAYALTRHVMEFAATKSDAGLNSHVVFLTDDPTETNKWVNTVQAQLPKGVTYAISHDGIEGPGSYGLNRNVTLTVLVGTEGKVTENFALIQPQLQADGPKIMKAIADVTGGGDVPVIEPERRARP